MTRVNVIVESSTECLLLEVSTGNTRTFNVRARGRRVNSCSRGTRLNGYNYFLMSPLDGCRLKYDFVGFLRFPSKTRTLFYVISNNRTTNVCAIFDFVGGTYTTLANRLVFLIRFTRQSRVSDGKPWPETMVRQGPHVTCNPGRTAVFDRLKFENSKFVRETAARHPVAPVTRSDHKPITNRGGMRQ